MKESFGNNDPTHNTLTTHAHSVHGAPSSLNPRKFCRRTASKLSAPSTVRRVRRGQEPPTKKILCRLSAVGSFRILFSTVTRAASVWLRQAGQSMKVSLLHIFFLACSSPMAATNCQHRKRPHDCEPHTTEAYGMWFSHTLSQRRVWFLVLHCFGYLMLEVIFNGLKGTYWYTKKNSDWTQCQANRQHLTGHSVMK